MFEFLRWFAALHLMPHRRRATCQRCALLLICADIQSLKAVFTTPFHFLAPQSYTFFSQQPRLLSTFFSTGFREHPLAHPSQHQLAAMPKHGRKFTFSRQHGRLHAVCIQF
jgi:hypothetical protein